VSRLNLQTTSARSSTISPREEFTGRGIDYKLDYRCGFGEYAIATVPNPNNSMAARTEECITLLPTGNRTGSVKMLSLATGQIATGDQFSIEPMPASAVARVNFLAAADGRVESISALLDHPPDSTAEYDIPSTPSTTAYTSAPTPGETTTSDDITTPEEPPLSHVRTPT
jgi:hypothetical protein